MIAVIMFVGIAMMTFIKPFLRIYVSKEYFIAWKYGIRKKLCAIECKKFLKMLERIAYFRPDIETGLLECYTKFTIIFWRLYYAQN